MFRLFSDGLKKNWRGGGEDHAVTMASAACTLLSLEKQIPPCRITRAGLQFTLN